MRYRKKERKNDDQKGKKIVEYGEAFVSKK
jgi:hypothetical protein